MKELWSLLLFWSIPSTQSSLLGGDSILDDFSCPAITTCPVVCVRDVSECRQSTSCPDGLFLCADGSCESFCEDDVVNPCNRCDRVACPVYEDAYEQCLEDNQEAYETCDAEELEDLFSLNSSAAFVPLSLFLLWVVVLSMLIVLWCRFNHHASATMALEHDQTQTGYTTTSFVGRTLYAATLFTLFGFQTILWATAWGSYYVNDKKAILIAFEIAWSFGFVWTLTFKWPFSIESIFWKQCPIAQADRICVFVPKQSQPTKETTVSSNRCGRVLATVMSAGNNFMSMIFAAPAQGRYGKFCFVPVRTEHGKGDEERRFFVFQFRCYNYNSQDERFLPGRWDDTLTLSQLVEEKGLSMAEVQRRLRIVGPNKIESAVPTSFQCLIDEFAKPFYTYQMFILWTWVPLNYFFLAMVHGTVIMVGGVSVAWFRYRNERNLYQLTHVEGTVEVLRDGLDNARVGVEALVPGDVVVVEEGKVHADMVIIDTGDHQGVLLDESGLTGESAPVAKTSIKGTLNASNGSQSYDALKHKKHTIAAGTTVLESKSGSCLAVVTSTGSYTSKGKLLREVFAYERHRFKFDEQVPIVIAILLLESMAGFMLIWFLRSDKPVFAWFYGIYVLSTLLPPLLPTCFTVSVGVSDNRLTKKNISCSQADDILVAGKVSKAFFDKTGTLTNQGLDFISARSIDAWESGDSNISSVMATGMSCCHGLMVASSGELMGNQVDQTMFKASGGHFSNRNGESIYVIDKAGNEYEIVKQFDFDHDRMTQSVILRCSDGSLLAYVKGSGESLQVLCKASTLPANFEASIRESASQAVYQIALATRKLPSETDASNLKRDEVERDLSFVGVINFKNILRSETPAVIQELEDGGVQCIMVTGDNLNAGISIAREAGLIKAGVKLLVCSEVAGDSELIWTVENGAPATLPSIEELESTNMNTELAMIGKAWETLKETNDAEASRMAKFIRVYGRCNPFHKVSVVTTFVAMDYVTLMCGDGGNDCGALKAAHVGIALSDAEASLVAPFASLDKSITSVVDVLKEGRCALASALASYKYIIMYGQIEAFINVNNAFFLINLSEYCWVFMDGFWMIFMGFSLPLAQAADRLVKSLPTASLLGPITVSSTCGILFLNIFFSLLALRLLHAQDWFQCRKWTSSDTKHMNLSIIGDNYESSTLFLVTGFQYISSAMCFNFGHEFRQGFFRNRTFIGLVLFFTTLHFMVTLIPSKLSCIFRVNCENEDVVYSIVNGDFVPIQNPFNSTVMPMEFRIILIILMLSNTAAIVGWDYFVVNGVRKMMGRKLREKESTAFVNNASEDRDTIC